MSSEAMNHFFDEIRYANVWLAVLKEKSTPGAERLIKG